MTATDNSMYKDEHLAKEADRLLHDDVLNHAIKEAKTEYTDKLCVVDPEDAIEIIKIQSVIVALDEVHTTLNRYILKQV